MSAEVTVTLFLSLTAVQFVLGDTMPASSYVSTVAFCWPYLWGTHGRMVRWRYAVRLD